jgi:outer membrane protein OmpA-like peptidoglycan-associated protein
MGIREPLGAGEEEGDMFTTSEIHNGIIKGALVLGILSAAGFGMPVLSTAAESANKLVSEEEFSALFEPAEPAAATETGTSDIKKRGLAKVPRPGFDSKKRETATYVLFETGSVLLKTPDSFHQLDNAGRAFKRALEVGKTDKWVIEIAGHTDNVGSAQNNLKLSQERAEAIRQYLIQTYGLPQNLVVAKGYGDTQPITSNETAEGRDQNRRVVFKVTHRTATDSQ